MTAKEKQGFGLYFLLAFGMAWLLQVYASLLLLRDGNAAAYQLLLVVSMFCPLVSVLLVQKFWLHQPTGISWRPRLKGNGRYLLAAWFGPAVFTVLAAVLYFAVFPSRLDTSGSWLATAYGGQWTPEALKTELGVTTTSYLIQNGLLAVTLAPLANMIPAVGEEAGWRGFMMPRLKERLGLLNGRLLGGVIWGVWHWPLMLLVGYEYGTNYLGAPLLGLVVWCVVCFALNTLLDWLYEKTGCIWVPAIAHGALNAVASMPVVLTDPAEASYYTVLGPMPIGLIGMLPVLAVAVWLTLRQMKQEGKNRTKGAVVHPSARRPLYYYINKKKSGKPARKTRKFGAKNWLLYTNAKKAQKTLKKGLPNPLKCGTICERQVLRQKNDF